MPSKTKITFTTSGPVIKRYEVSLTIKVQSVKAGEYTAPPAHGPAKKLIHVDKKECESRSRELFDDV